MENIPRELMYILTRFCPSEAVFLFRVNRALWNRFCDDPMAHMEALKLSHWFWRSQQALQTSNPRILKHDMMRTVVPQWHYESGIISMAISRDGQSIVYIAQDRIVTMDTTFQRTYTTEVACRANSVCLSQNGQYLAVEYGNLIIINDLLINRVLRRIIRSQYMNDCMAFLSNGMLLYVDEGDQLRGEHLDGHHMTFPVIDQTIKCLSVGTNRAVIGLESGGIIVYPDNKRLHEDIRCYASNIAINRADTRIAVCYTDGNITMWQWPEATILLNFHLGIYIPFGNIVRFNDENTLLVTDSNNTIIVMDELGPIKTLYMPWPVIISGHGNAVYCVGASRTSLAKFTL